MASVVNLDEDVRPIICEDVAADECMLVYGRSYTPKIYDIVPN